MGPRDATALRVSPGRRADGWPVSEAGPQSGGTSGEGAGTVMGSTSRPGTRPLLSETAGGRRRGIGPGSELVILKGTRVTCADWRSSSPGLLWPSAGALGEGSGVPSAGESPSCDRNGDPWRRLQADLGPRQGPSWGRSGPSPASCKPETAEGAGGTGRLSYHSRPVPRAVGFR